MLTCPTGHQTQSTDYCDVCGAPVVADAAAVAAPAAPGGPGAPGAPEASAQPTTKPCPACDAPNPADALFCEACGYDFTTGTMPRATAGLLDLDAPLEAPAAEPASSPEVGAPGRTVQDVIGGLAPEDLQRTHDADAPAPDSAQPVDGTIVSPFPEATPEAELPAPLDVTPAADPSQQPEDQAGPGPVDMGVPHQEEGPATPPVHNALAAPSAPLDAPVSLDPPAPADEPVGEPMPEPVVDAELPAPLDVSPSSDSSLDAPAATPLPVPPVEAPAAASDEFEWVAEVWVDPDWYAVQQAEDRMPSPGLPEVVPLRKRTILIGRESRSRGIAPEISCHNDNSCSRRQAQLTTDGQRWWVEDLDSANGTYVGSTGGPLPEHPITRGRVELHEDDRIYVGAWTRIVLRKATPDERDALA